jgi:hypothetical protein
MKMEIVSPGVAIVILEALIDDRLIVTSSEITRGRVLDAIMEATTLDSNNVEMLFGGRTRDWDWDV